ncbi:CHAT domain-containing protein [Hwangdonia sp.]|uniref:CHAT domain-containing protein n=1 Tax=Hwangdonia sp. TaxID=1883432 RepID=UPI003AB7C50F
MDRTWYLIICFVFSSFLTGNSQETKKSDDVNRLLFEFYEELKKPENGNSLLLSRRIDSIFQTNKKEISVESLAAYNNAKGVLYYYNDLDAEQFLIKADSLNNLLPNPNIDVTAYSSYFLGEYYFDKKEDLKAKSAYSKIIEIQDIPQKFISFKSTALNKTFLIERILVSEKNIDSLSARNTAKKLIDFKRSINDTINVEYGKAYAYTNNMQKAEKIYLDIKSIQETDVRYSKYAHFQALHWLNLYYYKNINYNIKDVANAIKLITVGEELLSIIDTTDPLENQIMYSVIGDLVVASIITKDHKRQELYEGKILDVLNDNDYPNTIQINLERFYFVLHKLKMYFDFDGNYEKSKFYAFKNTELTKYLYGEISVEYEQELMSYQSIINLDLFDYNEAYKVSLLRETIIKQLFGESSKEYLGILYSQYSIRLNQLNHKKGLKILEKAVSLLDKVNCEGEKICEDIKFSYLDCLNYNEMFEASLEHMRKFRFNENYESLFRLSATRISSYSGLKQHINVNYEYDWLLERISGQEEALIEDKDYNEYFFQFILNYQEHLRSTGRLNKAISITEKYLYLINDAESDLTRIDFMIGYLNILFQMNKCDEAIKFVENNNILIFSEINTPNAIALKEFSYNVTLANIYNCLENYPEAISSYEKAMEYKGLDTSYLYPFLINMYSLSGNEKLAREYLNVYEKSITNIKSLNINELYLIADLYIRNNEREKLLEYLLPLSDMVIDGICNKSFFSSNDNKTDKLTHDDVLRFILSHNYGELFNSKLSGNAVIISNLYKTRLDYFAKINLEIQKLKILENPDAVKLAKLENEFNKNPSSILEEEIGQIKTKLISSRSIDVKGLCDVSFQDIYESIDENEMVINLMSYKYNLEEEEDYAINFNIKESSIISPIIDLDDHYNLQKANNINSAFFDYIINDIFKNKTVNGDLINTFYIIPSGKSNLINFSAFSIKLEEKLNRKIKLHVINSLIDIPKIKNETRQNVDNLFLIGDIDYDANQSKSIASSSILTRGLQLSNSIENSGIPMWSYLPGTKKEIEDIEKIALNNNINPLILSQNKVTESNLKEITIDPIKNNVIHVATHGYFFSDSTSVNMGNHYASHKNPLLRSGLILSGANKNWNNNGLVDSNNDGVLTAEEISFMDLSGVELIVLSACDTGLGDVSNLEGINGLQRAFKLAGANKLIMSLWKVPDKETSEFFKYFYQFLLEEKLSINESFRATQKIMMEKYQPYFWASFVLLE